MAPTAGKRIGVLGGSFDPVHIVHLIIAETARAALGLDIVLFVPAAQQPLKLGQGVAALEHRVEMVRLAIKDNPHFSLSTADANRLGPSYSIDMLDILHREWAEHKPHFWFILGEDSLRTLPSWRDPEGVLRLTRLAVFKRPGTEVNIDEVEAQLPDIGDKLDWVDAPLMEISATAIRRSVVEGRSIRYLVSEAVREYIDSHRLYLDSDAATPGG